LLANSTTFTPVRGCMGVSLGFVLSRDAQCTRAAWAQQSIRFWEGGDSEAQRNEEQHATQIASQA
jgi:hypothetical protein